MVSIKTLLKKVVRKKNSSDGASNSSITKAKKIERRKSSQTVIKEEEEVIVEPENGNLERDNRFLNEDEKPTEQRIDSQIAEPAHREEDEQEEEIEYEVEEEEEEEENFEVAFEFDNTKDNEKEFACLSPEQIITRQEREIQEISDLFFITYHNAAALLRFFQWKKERLIQRYLENPEQVRKEAGIAYDNSIDTNSLISKAIVLVGDDMCTICGEDMPAESCTALSCKHRFCNDCWRDYLTTKIKEGEVTKLSCPHMKCNLIVDEGTVKKLVPIDIYERYIRFITKAFVEDSDGRIKWCPQPNCGNAITADMISGTVVKCSCGHRFCFSCHREAHQPATCEQVKQWEKKCKDDSETMHWKYANTKDCPRCEVSVEKNGGCNHMTCRQCKHEWCWVCMRPWKGHNDYYNCNKFVQKEKRKSTIFSLRSSKKDKAREKEEERERHRIALERYLHYYERYVNHSHSSELEKQIRTRAIAKMEELQKEASTTYEVQYILDGTEVLLESRNVLKYTYVVAYYLPESGPAKELFEYLQEDLEKTTELLSETLENPDGSQVYRLKALNTIQLAKTRKDNLLAAVVQGVVEQN